MSSFAEKQSCSSITSMSSGVIPAWSIASCAARAVILPPTALIADLSSNVERMSVTIDWPTISTAWSQSSCSSTNFSEARIAQADPSDVGEHWSFVSGW
jgi:hypothetical protein